MKIGHGAWGMGHRAWGVGHGALEEDKVNWGQGERNLFYSYFQVNRPRGRGTAMLIGVKLS